MGVALKHLMMNHWGQPFLSYVEIRFEAIRLSHVLVMKQDIKLVCQALYSGPFSYLLVRLEDVLCGDRAHCCAQRFDNSICHLRAHAGGIGVQNTEVALVTLHHQLQRAPLGVHAADVLCSLLTPPASTCRHTNPEVNLMLHVCKSMNNLATLANT